MKHIKLFEEFRDKVSKYEPVSGEFPDNDMVTVHTVEELNALSDMLEDRGYVDFWNERNDYLSKIKDKGTPITINWRVETNNRDGKVFVYMGQHLVPTQKGGIKDFVDYFKLKHEFRGHKLKRYGV
jgi:hypothetical protein